MSSTSLAQFMKTNKPERKNGFYAATKSLCDEKGNPSEWEIRPLTTKENEQIQKECTIELQVPGKPNVFHSSFNNELYVRKLICRSVVNPPLLNAELQDSYGVKTPEELIVEMIDNPAEYNNFGDYIQKFNGFVPMDAKIEEAKN